MFVSICLYKNAKNGKEYNIIKNVILIIKLIKILIDMTQESLDSQNKSLDFVDGC